jgi:hypothetical protein
MRIEQLEDRQVLAVDFASAFAVGSAADEFVWGLAVDGAGNSCIVGRFSGTVDFDPAAGIYELTSTPTSSGSSCNTFVAKYDPSGALLWAQGMTPNVANTAITAGSDGSVYVVGSFSGTAEFGPTILTSQGSESDVFVTKLDAGGNFVWTKRFGGTNSDSASDVSVDATGNVYVVGTRPVISTAYADAFFVKFDAAGNVLWSRAIGASSSIPTKGKATSTGWATGRQLTIDAVGNVYLTGDMRGTVDFDPSSSTTAVAGRSFVTKFSTAGNLIWARTFADTGQISGIGGHDIAVDSSGNVYTTGIYIGKIDFDPGKRRFILDSNVAGYGNVYATYISALNASGNFLWAKSTQSTGGVGYHARPAAMTLDGEGGIYIAGEFAGTPDFNPGTGSFRLTSAGDRDVFIWKLDTSGNFVWAGQMGGTDTDVARGVGVDGAGNIFVAGFFNGTAGFDPGTNSFNMTSAGGYDVFVAQLVQTNLLALMGGSPGASLANLFAESPINETFASTKQKLNDNRDDAATDFGKTASIDLALEEIDDIMQLGSVAELALPDAN